MMRARAHPQQKPIAHRSPLVLLALLGALAVPEPAAAAAKAAGQPKLNAYYQSAFADTGYQQRAFQKVATRWRTPAKPPAPGSKAVVQTVIDASGKLLSAFVSMSSGSKEWDKAALAAVQGAAPFEKLPASYQLPTLEVHFHVSWEK
jgi:TonB family protein